uniref:Uncharacterized protein n=1 Tax=Tanacetum cinerariifolium TaxID=118510 RepID=A0A699LBE2_TANCI|nr:hypothetical protein [Tanacetum cinerariifolium]
MIHKLLFVITRRECHDEFHPIYLKQYEYYYNQPNQFCDGNILFIIVQDCGRQLFRSSSDVTVESGQS